MGRLPRSAAALGCAVMVSAGGCAAPDPLVAASETRPPAARPLGVQDPAPRPSASPDGSCDPPASLRPLGPLPPPGRMPAGSTMARIVDRGRLIAGVNQNAYRMGFRDPSTGALVGFEIDLVRELARALFGDPNRVQFKALTAAERIPMVQSGEVDVRRPPGGDGRAGPGRRGGGTAVRAAAVRRGDRPLRARPRAVRQRCARTAARGRYLDGHAPLAGRSRPTSCAAGGRIPVSTGVMLRR